jgi:LuxR family maltose regulon positive regulatory protein
VLGVRAAILQGDRPRAARLLREALGWSRDNGFMRSILDGGAPVVELLKAMETSDRELNPARERLLRAAGVLDVEKAPAAKLGGTSVEALNARETEILRLVEQGLMNKQIASDLGLTEGTVKWYMQQIFQKLDVRRRAQAIHKAKHLGLLR